MSVVMADLDGARLAQVSEELAAEHPEAELVAVRGDVGDPEHHVELVEAARCLDGGLRLSVLNAGVSVPGLSWEVPLETWELTTRVNYWGVVHGLRAALDEFADPSAGRTGWVVAVASGAGLVATPGLAPYVATKHAVVGMMEATHHELARVGSPSGVSVVCPGNIATPMPSRNESIPGASAYPEVLESIEAAVVSGVEAGADPSTVADAIVEGVAEERFWLMPQPEIAWAAGDRVRRIGEGEPPVDLLG